MQSIKILMIVILAATSLPAQASDYKPSFISKPSEWVHRQNKSTWVDQKKEGTRGITDSLDPVTHTLTRQIVDFKITKLITLKQEHVGSVCRDAKGSIVKTVAPAAAPANVILATKQAEDAIKTYAKTPSAKTREAAQLAVDHAGDLMEVNQVY
jgi:hypothetical protein